MWIPSIVIVSSICVFQADAQSNSPGYRLEITSREAVNDAARITFRDRLELSSLADFGGAAPPFDAKISASVNCEIEGEYTFRIAGDESLVFTVDGAEFRSAGGDGQLMSVTISLASGKHDIVIDKSETGGEANLSLEWRTPGRDDFRTLDASTLTAPWVAPRVLVFSKTAGFRHDSIPEGIAMLRAIGARRDIHIEATEDASIFTDTHLKTLDAVVFLNTTGDVLSPEQEAAFERFIRRGGGFVGVHSASDTEYDWPFYAELVGAYFKSHPAIQEADVLVREPRHVTTSHLASKWRRRDEWYDFRARPKDHVNRILELDESTYQGGTMNGDHPIAWWHIFHGSRSLYCAMGHTKESYSEAAFIEFMERSVLWSTRRLDSAPTTK